MVESFNQMLVDVVNVASGNMLTANNILSWNIWFAAPQVVDQVEWKTHSMRWRESLEVTHEYPIGVQATVNDNWYLYDGTIIDVTSQSYIDSEMDILKGWFEQYFGKDEAMKRANDKDDAFTSDDLHMLMGMGLFAKDAAKKAVTDVEDAARKIF